MTSFNSTAQTVQVQDIQGQIYQMATEQLIKVARQCICDQFSSSQVEITQTQDAKDQVQILIGDYDHEVFMALFLDNRHRIIHHEIMFRGTIDAAAVYPREVVKTALKHNAAAVIFAHNHPSGVADPSQADITITRKLKNALALIEIRTLDHLIVGETVTSMAELGLV